MEQLMHRMRGIFALVGILLAVFLAAESWKIIRDMVRPDPTAPSISVSGEGKVFAKPDIGKISLGITSEAATVEAAQKRATEIADKIYAALKGKGIEEKDIKTTSYLIAPMYDQHYPSGGQLRGYQVSENFEVKIRDISKAGDVVAAASDAGANQVGGLSFTTEDPEKLTAEARAKAIENAKEKARELAGKLGIRLGKITSFYESTGPIYYQGAYAEKGGAGSLSTIVPPVPTGENEIVVNVTINYQIK